MSIQKTVTTRLRGTRKLYFERLVQLKDCSESQLVREIIDFYMKHNKIENFTNPDQRT